MIWIHVFARGETATLKQPVTVTVKGITRTTQDGTVSFDLPAPGTYNVIVMSQGYQTWQGDISFGQYANVQYVTLDKEQPAPEGYTGFCTISSYPSSFGSLFAVDHPDLGKLKDGYTSVSNAQYHAHIDGRCFTRYPPPLTQEELITRNVVQRVQGQIETAISSALAPISASIDALKAWIADNVFELLMKKLDEGARDAARK